MCFLHAYPCDTLIPYSHMVLLVVRYVLIMSGSECRSIGDAKLAVPSFCPLSMIPLPFFFFLCCLPAFLILHVSFFSLYLYLLKLIYVIIKLFLSDNNFLLCAEHFVLRNRGFFPLRLFAKCLSYTIM